MMHQFNSGGCGCACHAGVSPKPDPGSAGATALTNLSTHDRAKADQPHNEAWLELSFTLSTLNCSGSLLATASTRTRRENGTEPRECLERWPVTPKANVAGS